MSVSRGGPVAGEQPVQRQHLLLDQLPRDHPPARRRPGRVGDDDLVADRRVPQRRHRPQTLLPVVDVPGDHRRAVVPGGRAEPVPAHPVHLGRDGHLAVGLHTHGVDGAVDPEGGHREAHRRRPWSPGRRGPPGGWDLGRSPGAVGGRPRPAAGADGVARASSTGAPADASGRVRLHAVGAPTARARPRTAVAAAGRTAVSSVCGAGQPRLRARRRAPARPRRARSPTGRRRAVGRSDPSSTRPAGAARDARTARSGHR